MFINIFFRRISSGGRDNHLSISDVIDLEAMGNDIFFPAMVSVSSLEIEGFVFEILLPLWLVDKILALRLILLKCFQYLHNLLNIKLRLFFEH